VIGSGLGVDFSELFLSVVALLDVVCFFFFPLSIYIAVKGYSESEKKVRFNHAYIPPKLQDNHILFPIYGIQVTNIKSAPDTLNRLTKHQAG
jgi:hypothetical protein